MKNNLVSILIPTFNRSNLLKICLGSVLNQTYKNLEIIIIDDCSTDDTKNVVEEFHEKRIKYFRNNKNIGSIHGDSFHFKRFFYELMNGEYFIYITDDDYWPDIFFIEKCIKIFEKHKNLSSVIGGQISEFFEDPNSLETFNKDSINLICQNKLKTINTFYFHKDLYPTGYMKGVKFLEIFSENATSHNISVTGSLRSKKKHLHIGYLDHPTYSRWQGGYQMKIPGALNGDIYYINEPCVVARIHNTNASFRETQFDHFRDSIISINNGFSFFQNKSQKNFSTLNYLRKRFIKSISCAYLYNTYIILKGMQLTLTSKENNKRYVRIFDVMSLYIKEKIFFGKKEIIFFLIITLLKIKNFFKKVFIRY